jgi:hypothetical protein
MMDERQQFCPFCKAPNPAMQQRPQFHGQVPPPPYFYNNMPRYYFDPAEQPPETALVVLSAIIPIAGLIIGCICLGNHENRAGKAYLLAAGISFGVGLLISFMFAFMPLLFLFH